MLKKIFSRKPLSPVKLSVDGVGVVVVKRFRSSRSMRIIIKQCPPSVTVSVPANSSPSLVEKFINDNLEWIKKSLNNVGAIDSKRGSIFIDNGYYTGRRVVKYVNCNVIRPLVEFQDHYLVVFIPADVMYTDKNVQQIAKAAVQKDLISLAEIFVPERVNQLAIKYNFSYKKAVVNTLVGKYGRCSRDGVIEISCWCMKLPEYLRDFIILHELSHTVYFNHGKEFHALMNSLTDGNEKKLRSELKKYNFR